MPLPGLRVAGSLQKQYQCFGMAVSYQYDRGKSAALKRPGESPIPMPGAGRGLHFTCSLEEMAEKVVGAFVGAEIPTHGAYLLVMRGTTIADGFGLLGKKPMPELTVPIEVPARLAHGHVPRPHPVGVLGGISDICPEAGHPDTFYDIFFVWQGKVFGGRDIADQVRSVARAVCRSNGRRHMVVAGHHVRRNRPEHVVGGI